MESKALQEKLQKAYHSMLEHIEELVEKDKKPLKEAFTEAEEKLSEWQELSREEIEKISDELKTNLHDLGDASYELRKSLRETMKFDAAYLATNLWGTLANVADKTIIELTEFNESLQKHTATTESTQSAQQKHWLDDAKNWQKNYETALDQLDQAREVVRNQMKSVNSYSKDALKNDSEQSRHDLLAQMNQETTQTIESFYKSILSNTDE